MKDEYDFTDAKRGAVVPQTGKTRITMYVDNAVLEEFKRRGEEAGRGYQTLMNEVLRDSLPKESGALEETLRRIVREEIARATQGEPLCSVPAGRRKSREGCSEKFRAAGDVDDVVERE